MIKLLIISDDVTGALDTGVQFVNYGIMPTVLVHRQVDFTKYKDNFIEVLVVDAETRHVSEEEAYKIVYQIVKAAVKVGVQYLYKKTDSGLRGNICSELSALLHASGKDFLAFLPALPKMNRVTVGGSHYIDGVPLKESVFGKDPFEPVKYSYIPDLFQNTDDDVCVYHKSESYYTKVKKKTIGIFDADTEEDLQRIARHLKKENMLSVMAGCAGFAAALAEVIGFQRRRKNMPVLDKPLLVICGSVNPISKAQVEFAQLHGFHRITLSVDQQLRQDFLCTEEGKRWVEKLKQQCLNGEHCIIDTETVNLNESFTEELSDRRELGLNIATSLGKIVGKLLELEVDNTLMIIGGDTLLSFIEYTNCNDINIVCELNEGMVLSTIQIGNKKLWLISKSGGFGSVELLTTLLQEIKMGEMIRNS